MVLEKCVRAKNEFDEGKSYSSCQSRKTVDDHHQLFYAIGRSNTMKGVASINIPPVLDCSTVFSKTKNCRTVQDGRNV